jgi:purine-binding chemotaxis protein CheW
MNLFGKRSKPSSLDTLVPSLPPRLAGKYLIFELAGEYYGVLLQRVQEIVLRQNISPVRKMPHFALGTLDLRGNKLPVIDLRKRLHVREKKADYRTSILVVHVTTPVGTIIPTGFLVDAINDVLVFPASAIQETPYVTENGRHGAFVGLAEVVEEEEREKVTLIDLDPLLTEKDLMGLIRG